LYKPEEMQAVIYLESNFKNILISGFALFQLDGSEMKKNDDDEPDFYEQTNIPA